MSNYTFKSSLTHGSGLEKTAGAINWRRLLRAATRIPKNIDKASLAKYIGIGGILGGTGAAMFGSRENRLRNAAIGTVIGAAAGGYGNMLKHNIVSEMGGHFLEEPDYYNPETLKRKLDPKDKRVVFYVPGAGDFGAEGGGRTTGTIPINSKNTFVFAYGDHKKLKDAINSVPEGYNVEVLAHSAGVGGMLQALKGVKRDVDKAVSLDGVDLDPLEALKYRLGLAKRNPRVKRLINILPENFDRLGANSTLAFSNSDSDSDKWVKNNWLRLGRYGLADTHRVSKGDDHSMDKSGLRVSVDNKTVDLNNVRDNLRWI